MTLGEIRSHTIQERAEEEKELHVHSLIRGQIAYLAIMKHFLKNLTPLGNLDNGKSYMVIPNLPPDS